MLESWAPREHCDHLETLCAQIHSLLFVFPYNSTGDQKEAVSIYEAVS